MWRLGFQFAIPPLLTPVRHIQSAKDHPWPAVAARQYVRASLPSFRGGGTPANSQARQAARSQGGESALSIRFKHGTHTVFLFVDPSAPFSNITAELLNILRSRWPEGLSVSNRRPDLTVVPDEDEDIRVSYAVLKNPRDNNSGWKNLPHHGHRDSGQQESQG